jgi:hypothetical protein
MIVHRHVNNFIEDDRELSFDLVVNNEANSFTYGGGRVVIPKPFTPEALETIIVARVKALVDGEDIGRTKAPWGALAIDAVQSGRAVRNIVERARGTQV